MVSAPRWPNLKETVDAYWGEPIYDTFTEFKWRSDGCYIVMARDRGDGGFHVTDWAGESTSGPWYCQNDSEELSAKEWQSLKIDSHCDSFDYTEDE